MIHPAEMATDETMDDQTVAEAPESATPCSSSAERIRPLALVGREAVEQLSRGFLSVLEPELVRVHKSLEELVVNQDEMLASVHNKRLQFEDTSKMVEIQSLLQRLPQCRQNISVLARQMQTLGKRVKRLQQRAARLKELRLQRDYQKRKEMERRLEQERLLEAKPYSK